MYFDICQHFNRYFSLSIANTEELKAEVYKIRYGVYCEELGYESVDNFPNKMERDDFDSHSVHCLLKHKPTGSYAGCVRIVLPHGEKISSFPWQKYESQLIYPHPEARKKRICEISRLAVRSQFRKRKGDGESPLGGVFPDVAGGKRRFPLIAMSLYWAAFCLALNLKLDIFCIIEPRLARHLRRCGFQYCLVSHLFEFRGKRGIYFTKPVELLDSLDRETYEFFYLLNSVVSEGLQQEGYIEKAFAAMEPTLLKQVAIVR